VRIPFPTTRLFPEGRRAGGGGGKQQQYDKKLAGYSNEKNQLYKWKKESRRGRTENQGGDTHENRHPDQKKEANYPVCSKKKRWGLQELKGGGGRVWGGWFLWGVC